MILFLGGCLFMINPSEQGFHHKFTVTSQGAPGAVTGVPPLYFIAILDAWHAIYSPLPLSSLGMGHPSLDPRFAGLQAVAALRLSSLHSLWAIS